jgi:pimeloyl-ACP methyl ester carboxylesterase
VEVADHGGPGRPVVIFPGGHAPAATPAGAEIYRDLGFRALVFSRPGYGGTDVGRLTAAEFVQPVLKTLAYLGIDEVAAVVGVSFGGMQAAHWAADAPGLAPRLILHSCAPSSLPFPDTAATRRFGQVVFGPTVQRVTWRTVHRMVSSDRGLRLMMRSLSTAPIDDWWPEWTEQDREGARAMFRSMGSGTGFVLDCAQAVPERTAYRRSVLQRVSSPTLVTASRRDGGVAFAHAEDFATNIRDARLFETDAPSHLFWLGPSKAVLTRTVGEFLGVTSG